MATPTEPTGIAALVDRLSDKLPYADGSFRRRLLAGGIVALAFWAVSGRDVASLFTASRLSDVLANPLPSLSVAVSVYLLGTLVELIGNLLLVRAAAEAVTAARAGIDEGQPPWWLGVAVLVIVIPLSLFLLVSTVGGTVPTIYWTIFFVVVVGIFVRVSARKGLRVSKNIADRLTSLMLKSVRLVAFVFWWIPRIGLATVRGFLGKSRYGIDLETRLSLLGSKTLASLPDRVQAGLRSPVGDYGELAFHHVVQAFELPANQKWARKLIARVLDVSVVVSACVFAVTIFGSKEIYRGTLERQSLAEENLVRASGRASNAVRRVREHRSVVTLLYWTDSSQTGKIKSEAPMHQDTVTDIAFQAADLKRTWDDPTKNEDFESPQGDLNVRIDLLDQLDMLLDRARDAGMITVDSSWKTLLDSVKTDIRAFQEAETEAGAATRRVILRTTLLVLLLQVILLLYYVFFATARAAIENMVEALGIERQEPSYL